MGEDRGGPQNCRKHPVPLEERGRGGDKRSVDRRLVWSTSFHIILSTMLDSLSALPFPTLVVDSSFVS